MKFSDLSLSPELLRAVEQIGYETPSPIQEQALPILLGDRTDFLGLAGTGTGKTAAFAIPLLERINPKIKAVQALILCPTRELAMQVAGQIDLLGKFKGARTVTVYGGASYNDQIRGIRSGASIVVGTPGRVIDHIERGSLVLDQVQVLVLDEADEMFSMGFKEELDTIVESVPQDQCNTWLFSATMSPEVRRVAQNNLREPKTVQVNRTAMLSSGVEQYFYRSQEFEKPEMICNLIEAADDFYGLIFCQTKALVADLTRFMLDRGYKVDCLHGDKDQTSRERTMQAFRDRKLQVLICTDVAARGLDVKDITHVVNYSLPREMESYVHRIGRTARSGKTGIVMNLVTMSHRHLISRIESHTKVQMKEGFVPSIREVAAKKVSKLISKFEDQPNHGRVLEVMGEEWKTKLAEMPAEQIAAHFIAMMMPDVFGGEESRKTKKTQRETTIPNGVVIQTPARAAVRSAPRAEQTERQERPVIRPQVAASAPRAVAAAAPRSAAAARPIAERPTVVKKSPVTKPPVDIEAEERSLLDEPSVFGVTTEKHKVIAPRSFGGPREKRFKDQREERGPRSERAERAPRSFSKRPGVKAAQRPAAPMNLGKPPKHPPGPARTARLGELPELNRRARRAAKFNHPMS